MFKKDYYYIVAGLPELNINESRKVLTSLQFKLEMEKQLNKSDYLFFELLFREIDNKNLLSLLLEQNLPFDKLGNYKEDYLRSQIDNPTDIVVYMKQFITDFMSESFDQSPLYCENKLQESYYKYLLKTDNDFIRQWFRFDRDVKNLLTAVNCRKHEYDIEKQLVREDDGLYDALLQGIPTADLFKEEDLPYLEQVLQIAESNLEATDKELEIDLLKWTFLDEMTFFYYFTIEKILSFAIKLSLVDRWRKLDHTSGKALWERLIYDLEMSYFFADEFSLNHK